MERPDNTSGPRRRAVTTVVAVLAVGALLSACGVDAPPSVAAPIVDAAPVETTARPTASPVLVDPDRARALVDAGAVLVDVRTPEEFAEGHIEGALLVDIAAADFEDRLAELDRDAPHVVYCRSGNRSAAATARMVQLGFSEVYDAGGIVSWVAAGLPVVTPLG